jgi:hypothetical protein
LQFVSTQKEVIEAEELKVFQKKKRLNSEGQKKIKRTNIFLNLISTFLMKI